jgi:hypothetical protein
VREIFEEYGSLIVIILVAVVVITGAAEVLDFVSNL